MTQERLPAHAGTFYPENPDSLTSTVTSLLEDLDPKEPDDLPPDTLRALIVPHGEFGRSGPVAARAYRLLRNRSKIPDRVVILAPLHYFPEYGLILPSSPGFRIPTGSLPVDRKALERLAFHAETLYSGEAHQFEHAIEVQLPFLMHIWGPVPIVPLGVADLPADTLANILAPFIDDPETFFLFSADLSRYYRANDADRIDKGSIQRILAHEPVDQAQVCGATGINALSILAHDRGLTPRLLSFANSKCGTGDTLQTTGYASFGFSE